MVPVLYLCLVDQRIYNEVKNDAEQRKKNEHHGHNGDVGNSDQVGMQRAVVVDYHAQVKKEEYGRYQDRYHPYTDLLQMFQKKSPVFRHQTTSHDREQHTDDELENSGLETEICKMPVRVLERIKYNGKIYQKRKENHDQHEHAECL